MEVLTLKPGEALNPKPQQHPAVSEASKPEIEAGTRQGLMLAVAQISAGEAKAGASINNYSRMKNQTETVIMYGFLVYLT